MGCIAVDTQFGTLTIAETDGAITGVAWGAVDDTGVASPLLRVAAEQMRAYDQGRLQRFDLPLKVAGAPFKRAVCAAMRAIPFGETRSYGDLARALGQSAQAVGRACGGNLIPVIIPCHRVMGAGGRLVGYSGHRGVETKLALLRHEGAGGFLI